MFTDTDNEANTTQTAIMITCSVDLSRNNDAKEGEVTLSNAMMKEDFVSMSTLTEYTGRYTISVSVLRYHIGINHA